MKYMGSKRWMLRNGLADVIGSRISQHERFVDLFCGSAAVSWHVASNHAVPVLASDLQEFCRVLAASVICRKDMLGNDWIDNWIDRAVSDAHERPLFRAASNLQHSSERTAIVEFTSAARKLCATSESPITAAYGGYYFSPLQAIQLDSLRRCLPLGNSQRMAALAALVQAASACAASPGHTAQPFSPTPSAEPYLRHSWALNVVHRVRHHANLLSAVRSKKEGTTLTGDANTIARDLNEADLVFIDTPYSAVHYSRFYHVLETVAVGKNVPVSGTGRYPPSELRPRSRYSLLSEAGIALHELLETVGRRRAGAIITFPAGSASNGLSGEQVIEIARNWFAVDSVTVKNRFSTLGGNTRNRSARIGSEELLLSLIPK